MSQDSSVNTPVIDSAPPATRPAVIRVAPTDNVAIALEELAPGRSVTVDDTTVIASATVPPGHKIALRAIDVGTPVIKYGFPIGTVTEAIAPGDWVHSHNLATALTDSAEFRYTPRDDSAKPTTSTNGAPRTAPTFMGYRRSNGRVGTRNEVWIINTVGCVNHAAERIAKIAGDRFAGRVDGVYAFAHPYGCSQLGDDLRHTQRVLAGLLRHPNAGGVLVLGLGCENNQMSALLKVAGDLDQSRLRFFNSQDVTDEIERGVEAIGEIVELMQQDRRVECPVSDLVLGNKCGGSDGFSGISANAVVGRVADRVTEMGGSVLLTEVPEMFGAEQVLLDRAANENVYRDTVTMVNDFKQYFVRHDQPVYENPSPGNKAGGLTTLEEKSLGAIQKGGHATVERVLRYGEPLTGGGLSLLEAPGNDAVSSTAMVASGATVLLFTTGRGTPLGFPVPTIKVSSNTDIAQKKPHWIDFNAGAVLDGAATTDALADELLALVLDVASGRAQANNEKNGYREIAIWKSGVTL